MAWSVRLLSLSASFILAGMAIMMQYSLKSTTHVSPWQTLAEIVISMVLFGIGLLALELWRFKPTASHTLLGMLQWYCEFRTIQILGSYFMRSFKNDIKNISQTQKETSMDFLKKGSKTVYGKDHGFQNFGSLEEYRTKHPLIFYDDIKPYVDRALKGEDNIFFPEKVNFFGATSGTTSGKSKLFPINLKNNMYRNLRPFIMSFKSILPLPGFSRLNIWQNLAVRCKPSLTPLGIPKGSVSSTMIKQPHYSVTPFAGFDITTEQEGLYVHALFSLKTPDVGVFVAITSSVVLSFFSLIETRWRTLCDDIEQGQITVDLNIAVDVRERLQQTLKPDPARASALRKIFLSGFQGMATRIWPSLASISAVNTGPFAFQGNIISSRYTGNIPIMSSIHISTEGLYGLLLYDEGFTFPGGTEIRDDYIILPRLNFYEFIPIDNVKENQPKTLLAHEVEVGKDYEMVVTTWRGLYRYRTQDIVTITGFRDTAPKYRVKQRVGDMLNAVNEKLPEGVFRGAIEQAASEWTSGNLVNFTGAENVYCEKITGGFTGVVKYVIFVELDSNNKMREDEKAKIDYYLSMTSETYCAFRNKGSLQAPKIIQVERGSFDVIKDMALEVNPLLYSLQYKAQRILRKPEYLAVLLERRME